MGLGEDGDHVWSGWGIAEGGRGVGEAGLQDQLDGMSRGRRQVPGVRCQVLGVRGKERVGSGQGMLLSSPRSRVGTHCPGRSGVPPLSAGQRGGRQDGRGSVQDMASRRRTVGTRWVGQLPLVPTLPRGDAVCPRLRSGQARTLRRPCLLRRAERRRARRTRERPRQGIPTEDRRDEISAHARIAEGGRGAGEAGVQGELDGVSQKR